MINEANSTQRLTERERFETELAAITMLQQVGTTFPVPLKKDDIAALNVPKSFLNKLFHPRRKNALPPELKVSKTQIPDPNNPQEMVEYYEAQVTIRPMCLSTIDALRAMRLRLELKDHEFGKHLDSEDVNDDYLLRYVGEVCDALAIATLDDDNPPTKLRRQWAEFYRTHLTNQRYFKLAQIVKLMMDAPSFRASTRFILGLGTTTPREASRVENPKSKD